MRKITLIYSEYQYIFGSKLFTCGLNDTDREKRSLFVAMPVCTNQKLEYICQDRLGTNIVGTVGSAHTLFSSALGADSTTLIS